jgi:hypothetical protein
MASPSEVLNAALTLSSDQRAEVAHKLLLSLESDDFDADVDIAWAEEIQRRRQAIRDGSVVLRDWNVALSEIRQALDPRATE